MDQSKVLNRTLLDIKEQITKMQGNLTVQQFAEVLTFVSLLFEKPKGDPGVDSKPEDVAEKLKADLEFVESTRGHQGEQGPAPVRGVDYYTEEDIRVLLDKIAPLIHSYNSTLNKEVIDSVATKIQAGIKLPEVGIQDKDWELITEKVKDLIKVTAPNIDTSHLVIGVGTRTITVSATAPTAPAEGDLWVDTRGL